MRILVIEDELAPGESLRQTEPFPDPAQWDFLKSKK